MYIQTAFRPPVRPSYFSGPAAGGMAGLGNGKQVPIRQAQVKALIKARDKEIYALLHPLRIPCPIRKGNCVFEEVRRAASAGVDHVWTLAVTGDIGRVSGGSELILLPGKTVAFKPTTKVSKGKTTVTHPILVFVNPTRLTFGWPGLAKQIPNKQKRIEFHFAESLYHELIHAAIIIERDLPAGTVHGKMFAEFQRTLNAANSPRLSSARQEVKNKVASLLALAGVSKGDPAAAVDQYLEFLVHERFASQRAAFAFGRPTSNKQAAEGYSKVVASRVESAGAPAPDARAWKLRVNDLESAVSAWFDAIDARLAMPEILPRRGHFRPIIQIEPAILKL